MNENDRLLGLKLKIKYGTAPSEPSEKQLEEIKRDIKSLVARGREPTNRDWFEIVSKHCPGAGKYGYAGVDNSDLTTLLKMATNK